MSLLCTINQGYSEGRLSTVAGSRGPASPTPSTVDSSSRTTYHSIGRRSGRIESVQSPLPVVHTSGQACGAQHHLVL
ncbi:unnamed protein product [Protopolystoma xenopodis]|uniref:Uncharacterized protein n=1 Tax=Protopolystoma xenopodis TaxID=117903 RepID=A0A3S5A842_9PLAT|nr:unnamed protein product [Protopolystoma xenopodis]